MDGPDTYTFKLVLLGETAVGKSSLVMRFVKDQFHEFQESTIGGASPPPTWRCGGSVAFLPLLPTRTAALCTV